MDGRQKERRSGAAGVLGRERIHTKPEKVK
jgi:hypothetical protein